jgi:F420-non-reducing hydrogenase iron-sulfur subunit
MGIEKKRLRLEWISASEGDKVQRVINEMVDQLRQLGPLKISASPVTEEVESEAEAVAAPVL